MKFVLASGNAHKLDEYKRLLAPYDVMIEEGFDADETGETYKENAEIKLEALYKRLEERGALNKELILIADDSGLEVNALKDVLRVHTSRFLEGKSQKEKMEAVIALLKDKEDRDAFFICNIAYLRMSDQKRGNAVGYLKGSIGYKLSGTEGFGYDPIFVPKNKTLTLAELGPSYKNVNSHRYNAVQALLGELNICL